MTRPSVLLALVLIAACGEDLVWARLRGPRAAHRHERCTVDPDGYQVRVDGGAPAAIGPNADAIGAAGGRW